jgi:hypothetical protein
MATPRRPVNITVARVLAQIRSRCNREQLTGKVATRDLARYYGMLAKELRTIRLSTQEAILVWRALVTVWRAQADGQPTAFPSLPAAVEAEWRRCMGCQDIRGVDCPALVARLQALTPAQTLALVDAAERFQALVKRDGWGPIPDLLMAVGLGQGEPGGST